MRFCWTPASWALSLIPRTALNRPTDYLPITTAAMLEADEFWADAGRSGLPTAPEATLDADVILAAQAAMLNDTGEPGDALWSPITSVTWTDSLPHDAGGIFPEVHGP